MALDINGYNSVFNTFVQFAQENRNVDKGKAILDAKIESPLGGRKILSIDLAKNDSVHNWTRGFDQWTVNDRTRAIFKAAVANMFGGESKIPASVKKAMLLEDYNCGKPLTARRILAVKAAIDADGTAKARSEKLNLETFKSPEVRTEALNLGFVKAELPKLARAANFYAQAEGVDEMTAMKAVAEPGSKANRLMQYGGRFMENAANFADGLRLIDTFENWYTDLSGATDTIAKSGPFEDRRDYTAADTPSKQNADQSAVRPETILVMEKFVFESLAIDPSANLKETNGEAIFGFANNDASRFIGQNFGSACLNTVANIPPAKRAVVFKTFNLFCSLAVDANDHTKPAKDRYIINADLPQVLGRILRHLDEVLALDAKGKLTSKNVIKACFPDMRHTGNYDLKALKGFLDAMSNELTDFDGEYRDIANSLQLLMESTGCTLKEGAKALRSGKPIPLPQYVSEGQQPISEFGTLEGGRKALAADLYRPDSYSFIGQQQSLLPDDAGFGFTFPGEERFVTNGAQRNNISRVGDKVEELCGRVHPKQASSVMLMLTQSGLGVINRGLKPHGVMSTEHSAVDYTLTRNAETGAVTIKYDSPEGLPFHFSWTATVDVEGKITTTPLSFEKLNGFPAD